MQIPKLMRQAVIADDGWCLVAADASQLELRILAALSGDQRLIEGCTDDDLYSALADDSFSGERPRAKIAMLSAMYGGTSGEAGPLLAVLRKRFPEPSATWRPPRRQGNKAGWCARGSGARHRNRRRRGVR